MNNKNNIVILCGKSSSGKDTIARMLEKDHGYNFVISTTTRPIRPGESEKNPYYFVDNLDFQKLIENEELIEYREYNTLVNNVPDIWYYGVEKKEIDPNKKYVVVLDIVGLREFKKVYHNKVVSFFINANDEIRKERCISRGDFNESEWNRRVEDDRKVFSYEVITYETDYIVNGEQESKDVLSDVLNYISNVESSSL